MKIYILKTMNQSNECFNFVRVIINRMLDHCMKIHLFLMLQSVDHED